MLTVHIGLDEPRVYREAVAACQPLGHAALDVTTDYGLLLWFNEERKNLRGTQMAHGLAKFLELFRLFAVDCGAHNLKVRGSVLSPQPRC